MVRTLDPSEQRFVRHATYTGRSVTVLGELDAAGLGAAFAALQRAFPILVCRIVEDADGNGILLHPGYIEAVGTWVSFGDPDEIRIPTESMDPGAQLAYLDVVLAEEDRARVTMFVHHAVADAAHCVELFARLWDYYTDHLETGAIVAGTRAYPVSLESLLAQRGIERGPRSGLEPLIRRLAAADAVGVVDASPSSSPALARPVRIHLDQVETARVLERARSQAVSVNGLVTAAVLRGFAAVYGVANLACVYPVDLRKRLDPPVAAEAGTNLSGLAAFATEMPTDDIAGLARRIGTSLHDDLGAGVVEQSVLHFPDFLNSGRNHCLAGHVAVTNTGTVPVFRVPTGLVIDDYEIVYLSAHPRRSTGASAAVTFLVYTFLGRLTIARLGGGIAATQLLPAVVAELSEASVQQSAVSA
ncbi:MAG: acyltransferase [Nocardia sp.]|nr:acyltransferase [Nocardia sp.]